MQEENQTEELLLLTCSPHLTGYHLEQLAMLLEMMVICIEGTFYMVESTRIDEAEHTIYGQEQKITEYGEYK